MLPSDPVVMPTLTPKKENWYSVITPFGVTEAILPDEPSANQMLPSGPGVMNAGLLRVGVLE